MKACNKLSPFPHYDTDEIKRLEEELHKIEKNEYDDLPVVACKYCKSLYLISDELENDICANCGAVNEIIIYDNIKEYLNERQQEQEDTKDRA